MPSKSKQQQKFMGMAHALKKGEMKPSDASPELKKVAKSMSDKDVKYFASTSHKGLPKKVKQEIVKKLKELNESVKQSDYISGLKDLQKAVKSEKGSFQGNNGGNVAKLYYEKALKMGMDNKFIDNLTRKRINAYNKKAFSLSGGSLHTAVVGGIDLLLKNINEYANKMGRDHLGGDSIPSAKKGGLRDFDGYDNVDYNKDMPMDEVSSSDAYKISRMLGTGQQSTQDFIEDNKIDVKKLESYIKKLSPSKKIIIKDIINGSTDKRLSTIKKGLVKQVKESLDEAVDKSDLKNAKNRLKDPHTIEDIEYSKTRSGDKFVKIIYKKKYVTGKMMDTGPHFVSVFYNDEKDLQNIGKALKLKLKESLDESMMSTLDQMKKDSKNIRDFIKKVLSDKDFRDMKGDKDFIKYLGSMYEGVTEGGIPQNWMQGRTSDYHTKLRGKDREYDDTNFEKENSGQEDLEEYGQRLDLSYLEDEEARLDGTPKPKDAIDKDLEEQTLNELGVFPIRAFLQDMIPGNLLKTTTPQDKERLKSTIKDLIITLNKFWKQNNIPYRVREK